MDRRIIGTEIIEFIDGTEKEIKFYAIPSLKLTEFQRKGRSMITSDPRDRTVTRDNPRIIIRDEEVMKNIITFGVGDQLTEDEINGIETPLEPLYKKYYINVLTKEKKSKLSDISTPNQEQKSD